MHAVRRLLSDHRRLAFVLLALVLAIRALWPAGVMPSLSQGHIVISLCTGQGPVQMTMALPKADQGSGGEQRNDAADPPCAFSGLTGFALPAADPVLLAVAIMFVLAQGVRTVPRLHHSAPAFLRPPLRGPPALV
ncbi:MAG: DUF2946 family protein [Pseudomonadota bacterium]